MTTKRIDPNEVAAWFKAHPDIKPVRESFVEFDGDKLVGCCGLTSLLIGPNKPLLDDLRTLQYEASMMGAELAARNLRLDFAYALGLAHGWDSWKHVLRTSDEYLAGHDDGKAAYTLTMEALN